MSFLRFFSSGNNNNKNGNPQQRHPRADPLNSPRGVRLRDGRWLDLTCGVPLELLPDRGTITWSYLPGDRLGQGGFGVVVKGTYTPSKADIQRGLKYANGRYEIGPIPAAVKVSLTTCPKGRPDQGFENELRVLRTGKKHRHVVEVLGYGTRRERNFLALEMAHGSVSDLWMKGGETRMKEVAGLSIVGQVASSLAFLHGEGIGHFDLKPANVLVMGFNKLWVKITDFGLSEDVKDERGRLTLRGCRGTRGFTAPEMDTTPYGEGVFTESADIWSLGAMGLVLLGGVAPETYSARGRFVLKGRRLNPHFWQEFVRQFVHVSHDVRNLLSDMIAAPGWRRQKASGDVLVQRVADLLARRLDGKPLVTCVWAFRRHDCTSCNKVGLAPFARGSSPKIESADVAVKQTLPVIPRSKEAPSTATSRTVTREVTTKVHTGAGNNRLVVPGEPNRRVPSAPTRVGPPRGTSRHRPAAPPSAPAEVVNAAQPAKTEELDKVTVWTRIKRFFSKKRG